MVIGINSLEPRACITPLEMKGVYSSAGQSNSVGLLEISGSEDDELVVIIAGLVAPGLVFFK